MRYPNLRVGDIITVRYAGRLFPACRITKLLVGGSLHVMITAAGMDPFVETITRDDVVCYANTAADRAR